MTRTRPTKLDALSTRAVRCPDLIASFEAGRQRGTAFYQRQGNTTHSGYLALGNALDLSHSSRETSAEAARRFQSAIQDLSPAEVEAIRMVGWVSFDPDYPRPTWSAFGRRQFFIPEVSVLRHGNEATAVIAAAGQRSPNEIWSRWRDVIEQPPQSVHLSQTNDVGEACDLSIRWLDDERFRRGVQRVIADRGVDKVVLARRALVEAPRPVNIGALLQVTARDFPSCTQFAIAPSPGAPVFAGATPERLVAIDDRQLSTMALAGTTRHDADDAQSRHRREQALRNSHKDRREHRYVVDSIRDRLAPFCSAIDVAPKATVRRLLNVSHLETKITARVDDSAQPAEIVEALHPTPAVCGVPRDQARHAIAELEGFDRGLYAGTFGWIDATGDADFHVALRCGLVHGRSAMLFAGAGITADSDVDVEVAETTRKFGAIRQSLAEVCHD